MKRWEKINHTNTKYKKPSVFRLISKQTSRRVIGKLNFTMIKGSNS